MSVTGTADCDGSCPDPEECEAHHTEWCVGDKCVRARTYEEAVAIAEAQDVGA